MRLLGNPIQSFPAPTLNFKHNFVALLNLGTLELYKVFFSAKAKVNFLPRKIEVLGGEGHNSICLHFFCGKCLLWQRGF